MNSKKELYVYLFILIVLGLFIFGDSREMTERTEVAKIISAEACSEGKLGMWLVGNTIANRVKLYNKTPYQIVTQKNQYFGYTNPNKDKIYKDCKNIANMIAGKIYSNTLEDFTNNAIYYLRPDEKVRKWHKKRTITFKNHTFYK